MRRNPFRAANKTGGSDPWAVGRDAQEYSFTGRQAGTIELCPAINPTTPASQLHAFTNRRGGAAIYSAPLFDRRRLTVPCFKTQPCIKT